MKLNGKRPELIRWLDSRGASPEWETLGEAGKMDTCICRSVGWVIKDTKRRLVIAPHLGMDPQQSVGHMTIPKRCVLSRKNLK